MKTMLSRVLAVAVAVGAVAVPQVAEAADGPVQMPGTSHWYQVIKARLSWDAARDSAASMTFKGVEGHLATVSSAAENELLASLANTGNPQWPDNLYWLGGRDSQPSQGRRFLWSVGPELGEVFTECTSKLDRTACTNIGFTSWGPSEPNNYNGADSEACLELVADGRWNDATCSNPQRWTSGYIVEFELTRDPADPTPIQMPGSDHWYQLVAERHTWEQARDLAASMSFQGMKGHLANITSASEQQFIQSQFSATDVYVGGMDTGPANGYARNWTWMVGPEAGTVFSRCLDLAQSNLSCSQPVSQFAAWGPGQPDNASSFGQPQIYLHVNWNGDHNTWDDVHQGWQMDHGGGFLVEFEPSAPSGPTAVVATPGDSVATVTWIAGNDGGSAITGYTVTASPGAASCTTTALSCTVPGLTNRQTYTFTVTATNTAGTSHPSTASAAVTPLAPGFQAWSDDSVLALGSSTTVRIAQAAAAASVAVTGSAKATVTADSTGLGSATFTATKAGIQKFTASYSVKVGKKTTKYTATTQLYVPALSGPMLKIKQGKAGKFSLQFMPPGAAIAIALSDGQTLTGTADSAGKASFTPTFNSLGAVMYTASVAGVQVGTGGLTVTK